MCVYVCVCVTHLFSVFLLPLSAFAISQPLPSLVEASPVAVSPPLLSFQFLLLSSSLLLLPTPFKVLLPPSFHFL